MKRIFLLIICLFLAGCLEDSKEIDQRTLVLGIGIDQTDEGEMEVVMQMPIIAKDFEAGGEIGGEAKKDFVTKRAVADSIWNAVVEIEARTPTVLFFGHLKSVIIGENLARDGIDKVLDFTARRSPIDNRLNLLIASKNDSIYDILQSETPLISLPSLYIESFFDAEQKVARSKPVQLYEFKRDTNMISKSATIPMIYSEHGITIENFAVMKDEKMVTKLLGKQAGISTLLKTGELAHSNYTIDVPIGDKDLKVSLKFDFDLDVSIENPNTPHFRLDVSGKGEIVHISEEAKISTEVMNKVQETMEETIENEIIQTINTMKEHRVEPWLLGHRLWVKYPDEFDEETWLTERWPNTDFTITTSVEIEKTGQKGYLEKKKIGR